MSRLSFRPRPLDIHKKLPIFRSSKDFEDDETPASTRNSQTRLTSEIYNEAQQNASKKTAAEIPIPQFVVVDTYERDYSCTFKQLTSYIHARGARSEIGEFVEYDLDNEDEDWLEEFNKGKKILTSEKFESLLFKLDVLDHKARERAGVIIHNLGSPVPILLNLDTAAEAVKSLSVKYAVLQSVFIYWKEKRERWQKPILRRLQPPPPVNDTNPYNVFRPREKAHRLHTRRMQRRENNVQSFERLRQVRCNLEQAKMMLEALIKREEKKREVMESEVNLQRIQMKYKNETQLVDDGMALSNFTSFSYKLSSSDDEHDSGDMANDHPRIRMKMTQNLPVTNSKKMMNAIEKMKRDTRGRTLQHKWFRKKDTLEPVLLFTKDLNPEKLVSVGITSPSDPPIENGSTSPLYHFRGRIGRGGRIIFDRCHTLSHSVNGMSCRTPNA